ncbi:hypothetical protein A4X17_18075 [Plantibacter sp. H53]|nr:hypothetical protein A4X17_18075 [Plantibacter sp. H53]
MVGTDFAMYYRRFLALNPASWADELAVSPQEVGYTALSLAIRSFTDEPALLFWIIAVLTVTPVYIVLHRFSQNLPLAILLYILLAQYLIPLNLVRQGVAISFVFFAVAFLSSSKWKFFLGATIAILFHASAILILAVMIFSRDVRPTAKKIGVLVAIATLGAIAVLQIDFFAQMASLLNPRYETYLVENRAGLGTYFVIGAKLALALVVVWIINRTSHVERFSFFMPLSVAFLILGTASIPLARLEYYFGIFAALVIPNVLSRLRNPAPLTLAICLASSAFFVFWLLNYGGLLPYRWE